MEINFGDLGLDSIAWTEASHIIWDFLEFSVWQNGIVSPCWCPQYSRTSHVALCLDKCVTFPNAVAWFSWQSMAM